MKVVVFDVMNEPDCIGQVIDTEKVTVSDEAGNTLCTINTPVIVTEEGEILRGYECWWMPLEEFVTINHQMLYEKEVCL
jgi:hypothetical protein